MPDGFHFAGVRQSVQRPLHGALAGAQRQCQGGAGPGFAVGKKRQYRRVLVFHRSGQHRHVAGQRLQLEAVAGGVQPSEVKLDFTTDAFEAAAAALQKAERALAEAEDQWLSLEEAREESERA